MSEGDPPTPTPIAAQPLTLKQAFALLRELSALSDLAFYGYEGFKVDEAGKLVEDLLRQNPGNPQGMLLQGRIAMGRRQYAEAVDAFQSTTKVAPTFAPARYYLALAHFANKDVEQGRAALQEALKIDPKYLEARLTLADISLKSRNFDAALEESGRVLQAQPDNYQARLIAGSAAFRRKDYVTAERHFQELLRIFFPASGGRGDFCGERKT